MYIHTHLHVYMNIIIYNIYDYKYNLIRVQISKLKMHLN